MFPLLSKYIVLNIFKEWLDMIELCKFDSSICNTVHRSNFISFISDSQIVFAGSSNIPTGSLYFKWIQLRQLSVSSIVLHTLANRKYDGNLGCEQSVVYFKIENCAEYDLVTIREIISLCINLVELHIHCTYLNDDTLLPIITTCVRSLRVLNIANIFAFSASITCKSIDHILTHCTQLTTLDVSEHVLIKSSHQLDSTLFLTDGAVTVNGGVKSSQLTSLNFGKCVNLTSDYLQHIVAQCPQLTSIYLQDCLSTDNDCLFSLSLHCSNIIHIDLSATNNTRCSQITSLGLNQLCIGCKYITDISLTESVRLDLNDCVLLLAETYTSQLTHLSLNTFNLITTTNFTNNYTATKIYNGIFHTTFQCIADSLPFLITLHISSNSLNDESLLCISEKCIQLERISFTSKNVSDIGIISIVTNCVKLVYISLYCLSITDECVLCISQHNKQLIGLELRAAEKITNHALISVSNECKTLQTLKLTNCLHISDEGITHVVTHSINLKELSILSCSSVTSGVIRIIAEHCVVLEKLSFYVPSASQKAFSGEIKVLKKRRKRLRVQIC